MSCIEHAVDMGGYCECEQSTFLLDNVCEKCDDGCLSCDEDTCYVCDSHWTLNEGECECADGYVLVDV